MFLALISYANGIPPSGANTLQRTETLGEQIPETTTQ